MDIWNILLLVILLGWAAVFFFGFIGYAIYAVFTDLRNKGWHWAPAALVATIGGPLLLLGAWAILSLFSGFTLWT